MERDAWIVVGIFAFIFIIWIFTGGPTNAISFSGPTIPYSTSGSGTSTNATSSSSGGSISFFSSLPRASFGSPTYITLPGSTGSNVSLTGGGSVSSGGSNSSVPPASSLSGVGFGTPSPYRGLVTLSHGVSDPGASNPNNESLTLYVSPNAGTPVDITGWTLESAATGKTAVIPKGTTLPRSGVVNEQSDIVLLPGQQAIISSGRSPIGASFQENKCIGYYSNFQNFTPSLPQNCPDPSSELQAHYGAYYIRDAACIDYVNTIPRCKTVLTPPTNISGACQSFVLKYLNYNGCVDEHQNDSDFYGNTWRVYLGRTASMWRQQHEVVKLLDKQGKTVDAFSY